MAEFMDDMEFLVKETFAINKDGRSQNPLFDYTQQSQLELPLSKSTADEIQQVPESPGLLYRIDMGVSTFCIRMYPTHNIKKSCEDLELGQNEIISKLKLPPDGEDEYFFQYYPTQYYEFAEILVDQLANQRFPIREDKLCNLSDPGFSWWLETQHDSLKVYFKNISFADPEKVIKLGPLGDPKIAAKQFLPLGQFLGRIFPVEEFFCTDKYLFIKSEADHVRIFNFVKNFFIYGDDPEWLLTGLHGDIDKTLYYYLVEISLIRKFWLEIDSEVAENLKVI